jgi:hypothetical protein
MIRGIYFWAGSATVDLQRIKFPDVPIDIPAHLEAYSADTVQALANSGINTAFVSMNWGFPPEMEERHWREFVDAVKVFHDAGIEVYGYVQSSNCVKIGSYANKDWYAMDPHGREIPYYPKRIMTCWHHPQWLQTVRDHAVRAITSGADGVFFDNVWMGATAWMYNGRPAGFAGCACKRCRKAFKIETNLEIPDRLRGDDRSRIYLRWRANVVRSRLSEWRSAVTQARPDAKVMMNNCDVVLRDTASMFGLDPAILAPLQDAILIENIAVPHVSKGRLVANAVPLKALRAVARHKQILSVAYHRGIGLDGAPSVTHIRRHIAEAVAVGAAPVVKGSEYLDDHGRFSVFTARAFDEARAAAAQILKWLEDHEFLFKDRRPFPAATVALPEDCCDGAWNLRVTPALRTALQLVARQVPFDFTRNTAPVRSALPEPVPFAKLNASALFEAVIDPLMRSFARAYFGRPEVRKFIDRSGLTARFLRSPHFNLPRKTDFGLELPSDIGPTATSPSKILVERWRSGERGIQLHLVNYEDTPARVHLDPRIHHCDLFTPDERTMWVGSSLRELELENYAILEFLPTMANLTSAGR